MKGFSYRLLAYLLVIAGVFELLALAMGRWGWEAVLREDGLIEWGEVGVLALAGALAVGLVWRAPRTRGVYGVLAVGLWLIVFREFDNSAAYRALSSPAKVAIVILLLGGVVFLDRHAIVTSLVDLLGRPQGILFLLGTVLVFVWAQLLGQPAFWIPLYHDPGRGRRVVEESLELAGHILILCGVIEEHLHLRRLARGARPLLAVCLLLLAGCQRGATAWTAEGDLLAVEQPGPWLTIAHDDIPDLMPAMTMRLPVRSADVAQGAEAGTRVRFDLVRDGGRLVVTRLERLGPATGAARTEVQDQTPHHGGVVTMAGFLHVEAAASRDGVVRLWLTDAGRQPVSLAGDWGHVTLELPGGERRTIPLVERDGTLVAVGPPLSGDEVRARVELRRDGPPIDLYFVLPLTATRPGAAGVPAAGCVAVTPPAGGGRAPRCTIAFPHGVLALATAPDGTLALVSEAEGGVTAWRLPAAEIELSFAPPPAVQVTVVEGAEPDVGASAIAPRADGREAVIAFGPRLVRYAVDTGKVVRELPAVPNRIRDLAWSPAAARLLVSSYDDPDARLLDADTGQQVRSVTVASEAASVAYRADGQRAAVGGELGPIVVFDPATEAAPQPLADVLQPVEDLAFAGDRVVWAGADRSLRVWGPNGAEVARAELAEPAVRVAVASGGAVVAVALRSGTLELRRVADGALVETLRWHTSGVRAVAWAGPILLSGDTDGTLAVWDLGGLPGVH